MRKNIGPTTKKAPNYGRILAWVIVLVVMMMYLKSRIRFANSQGANDKSYEAVSTKS